MPRPKKDNKPISIRLSRPIFERLQEFCEDSGQTKTTAIERAITMYIDDYDNKMEVINKAKIKS